MDALYATLSNEQRRLADRTLAGTLPALYDGAFFTPDAVAGGAARMAGEPPPRGRSRGAPSGTP